MKRIAVGQILQETNTLNPKPTGRPEFELYGLERGPGVMDRYGDVGELAGFSSLPRILGEEVEWVGLVRAQAWSGGLLEDEWLEELVDGVAGALQQAGADGVLLSLHGALAAAGDPDVTGKLLARARQVVGPDIPVVGTLDLHANLTRCMVQSADVLVGYHTAPHIDQVSCGERAGRALAHLLGSGARPRVSAWKIPMLVADARPTNRGLMADLYRRVVAAEARPEVLSAGLYMAQPWFDVPELGWTLYQAYLGEAPPLDPQPVARECWATRQQVQTDFLRPAAVVPAALRIPGRPVAVSEGHDATNSGAPGDSTLLLAELCRTAIPEGGALTFCVDAPAVQQCLAAGTGAELDLEVGGRLDPYSDPLRVRGQVVDLGEIRFRLSGHGGHNLPIDMGRAAIFRAGDATVVLVEQTGPGSTPLVYEAVGLDPRDFKIVVAKSPEGFRQDYEPFAAGILYCGAPGCATPYLEEVDFRQVSRPLFPADPLAEPIADWAGDLAG